MKILQVINSLKLRGAEVVATTLAKGLKAAGCDVTLMVLNDEDSPNRAALRSAGIPVLTTGPWNRYSPRHIGRICSEMASGVYDIVHAHLYPAQLWATAAAARMRHRPRVVTTEHSTWNFRRRFKPLAWLDRKMYLQFDAVACISEAVEASLKTWLKRDTVFTQVIPNGAACGGATPRLDKNTVFHTRRPVLLSVGSFVKCKNQSIVIEALSRCPDAELFLAGTGPLLTKLSRRAADLGVFDRVHFLGERQDVPALMAAADIYVQPSRHEGFGLATLEAMNAGLPVVVSDVPGLAELVSDAGLKANPDSAEGFARSIRSLLDDRDFSQEVARKARCRALKFSSGTMVSSYMELYSKLLAPARTAEGLM